MTVLVLVESFISFDLVHLFKSFRFILDLGILNSLKTFFFKSEIVVDTYRWPLCERIPPSLSKFVDKMDLVGEVDVTIVVLQI